MPPRLGRDHGYRGDRLALIRVHREHGERDGLGARTGALVAEREDEEVEAVVEPGVENRMRRLAGEPRAQAAELPRALERYEEARVRAGKILGDAELSRDLLVQVGRTGREGIPSAAAGTGFDRRRHVHTVSLLVCDRRSSGGEAPPPERALTTLPFAAYMPPRSGSGSGSGQSPSATVDCTHCVTFNESVASQPFSSVAVTETVWHSVSGLAG